MCGTKDTIQEAVEDVWNEKLAPIFGFPGKMYSDNGTHFVGRETTTYFESHGTTIYDALVSYPVFVDFNERSVQLVLRGIRRWVFIRGPPGRNMWGSALPRIQLDINSKYIRVHSFYPAQILLRYKPDWSVGYRHEMKPPTEEASNDVEVVFEDLDLFERCREELHEQALFRVGTDNDAMAECLNPRLTAPRESDMIVLGSLERERIQERAGCALERPTASDSDHEGEGFRLHHGHLP